MDKIDEIYGEGRIDGIFYGLGMYIGTYFPKQMR